MKSVKQVQQQRLLNKARRAHKKSSRLHKKIQRAAIKQNPNMAKINKWQNI